MSQRNGDKSRFHRERKQNILRRKRTRELLQGLAVAAVPSGANKKLEGSNASPKAQL
jgi:hypothetical protein